MVPREATADFSPKKLQEYLPHCLVTVAQGLQHPGVVVEMAQERTLEPGRTSICVVGLVGVSIFRHHVEFHLPPNFGDHENSQKRKNMKESFYQPVKNHDSHAGWFWSPKKNKRQEIWQPILQSVVV